MLRTAFALLTGLLLASCGITEPNVVSCEDDCPGATASGAGGRGGESSQGGSGATSGTTAGASGAAAGDGGAVLDAGGDAGGASDAGGDSGAGTAGTGGTNPDAGSDAGADAGDGGCGPCPETAPHCTNEGCAECTQDEHCEPGVCVRGKCVECRVDHDCSAPVAAHCITGRCVPCESTAHCAHLPDTPVCEAGICVQCTAEDASACGRSPGGVPYVCDVLSLTCSTHTLRSASLCDPCVSDDQCQLGQLCALQRFDEVGDTPDRGELDVGYFCFWREDATEPNAPAGDCVNVRPYVATLENTTSVDGTEATVCGLATTTCAAYRDYRSKPCADLDDDAACGDPRFASDGYCELFSSSTYRCTTPCGSDDDCNAGFSCTTTPPKFCSLQ